MCTYVRALSLSHLKVSFLCHFLFDLLHAELDLHAAPPPPAQVDPGFPQPLLAQKDPQASRPLQGCLRLYRAGWVGLIQSLRFSFSQNLVNMHQSHLVLSILKPELPWTHHGLLALGSLDRVATLEVDGLLRDLQALFPLGSS